MICNSFLLILSTTFSVSFSTNKGMTRYNNQGIARILLSTEPQLRDTEVSKSTDKTFTTKLHVNLPPSYTSIHLHILTARLLYHCPTLVSAFQSLRARVQTSQTNKTKKNNLRYIIACPVPVEHTGYIQSRQRLDPSFLNEKPNKVSTNGEYT